MGYISKKVAAYGQFVLVFSLCRKIFENHKVEEWKDHTYIHIIYIYIYSPTIFVWGQSVIMHYSKLTPDLVKK